MRYREYSRPSHRVFLLLCYVLPHRTLDQTSTLDQASSAALRTRCDEGTSTGLIGGRRGNDDLRGLIGQKKPV